MIDTVFSKKSIFDGDIQHEGVLRVEGIVRGMIRNKGTLIIVEGALIKGNVFSDEILLGGVVRGDVTATKKLTILETSVCKGSIKSPSILAKPGFSFKGDLHLGEISRENTKK